MVRRQRYCKDRNDYNCCLEIFSYQNPKRKQLKTNYNPFLPNLELLC